MNLTSEEEPRKAKKLDWKLLVRFSPEEKPEVKALVHRLGLKSMSSAIRGVTLTSARQQQTQLDPQVLSTIGPEHVERILEEVKSVRSEIEEMKKNVLAPRAIDRSSFERRALGIVLDPSNHDQILECTSEHDFEDFLYSKDPGLNGILTVENEGVVPFESLLRFLHVNEVVNWKERYRKLDWDSNRLKAFREELKMGNCKW